RLANLSVRTRAGAGAQTLIAGFVVDGAGARDVLLRGVGPTLEPFGVTGVLKDPKITVVEGAVVIGTNDDWEEAANVVEIVTASASVGAFALSEGGADAAGLMNLDPGARTVQVTGADGGQGIALVEAYDVGGDEDARLVNISARSQVGTGANVLIAGCVLDGPASLLVRGIGPAFAPIGGSGAQADPVLQIYRGDELLAQSNDLATSGDAEDVAAWADAVLAFELPEGSKDAALLIS